MPESDSQETLWGVNGLEPVHDSLQMKRLTSDAERLYLKQWANQNVRVPCINSGYTLLEWILCPCGQRYPDCVSQRDAHVAASVIQWLGTNCGGCFVRQVESQIERLRAARSSWDRSVLNTEYPLTEEEKEGALLIAQKYTTGYAAHMLAQEIRAAIAGRITRVRDEVHATTRPIQFEETSDA